MILHRVKERRGYANQGVALKKADLENSSSVSVAMESNKVVKLREDVDPGTNAKTDVFFPSCVKDIRDHLRTFSEAIKYQNHRQAPWNYQHLVGFEYLDLVHTSNNRFRRLSEKLGKYCGSWPKLAKAVDAVVLFGCDFPDILRPNKLTCAGFKELPKGKSYLAIEAATMDGLAELLNGTNPFQIIHNINSFRCCTAPNGASCDCDRVQDLLFGKNKAAEKSKADSAIILGRKQDRATHTVRV